MSTANEIATNQDATSTLKAASTSTLKTESNVCLKPDSELSSKQPSGLTLELMSRISWEYYWGDDPGAACCELLKQKPLSAFAPESVALCKSLSFNLTHDPRAKIFPDLMALGFALRSFCSLEGAYTDTTSEASTANSIGSTNSSNLALTTPAAAMPDMRRSGVRFGRGLAFHFAPNNVETLFLYSLFLSILAGNTNVVRLGQKQSPEQQVLLTLLKESLAKSEHQTMAQRLLLVRYGHDDAINALFSSYCVLRIIWGGNDTVENIRKIAIPAAAGELTFAHKFSWSVLSAPVVAAAQPMELSKLARNFVTDAFAFGQQACASPGLIVWVGDEESSKQAKSKFWVAVDQCLTDKPFVLSAAQVSERFTKMCQMACSTQSALKLTRSQDLHSYCRLELSTWDALESCRKLHGGNGVFLEMVAGDLSEALQQCNTEEQTITSFGIEAAAWRQACNSTAPLGLCRIVPVGQALAFNAIWDGHDLIAEMSRQLTILV